MFLSNWAGPVYWGVAGVLLLGGYTKSSTSRAAKPRQTRDWVAAEHAHLHRLATPAEKRVDRPGKEIWARHVALMTLFAGVMLVSVMAACTALRTHLFIWTVFSPKYLFAMAWGVAWHAGITMGVGGVVWWMGGW